MTEKPKLLDYLQHNHSIRLDIMSRTNKVKQTAEDDILISDELEEEINELHSLIKQFVETHEKGLTKLEENIL